MRAFGGAVYGLSFVQQQFFPASNRPELLVTMSLPKNASIAATQAQTERLEKALASDFDVSRFSSYVGAAPSASTCRSTCSSTMISWRRLWSLRRISKLATGCRRGLRRCSPMPFPMRPPASRALNSVRLSAGPAYRVSASTTEEARQYADQLANALRSSGLVRNVNYDWAEKSKKLRMVVDQDRVRQAGLSSEQLAQALNRVITGTTVTQVCDLIYPIDIVAQSGERRAVKHRGLAQSPDHDADGAAVPLRELARFQYDLDEGYVWRRGRLPTITVQAEPLPGLEPASVDQRFGGALEVLGASMPAGTLLKSAARSRRASRATRLSSRRSRSMIAFMLTVLMFQLGSFRQLALVISVAPLGLIGVVAALLTTGTPMGFIAILGVIALAGMIIRNSVILVDQIEHERARGVDPWEAVIEATKHRFRPIMLTAAAAILGMIPIMHDVFWGPMAYAIVGGLAVATALTLVFLPALYVAVNGIREKDEPAAAPDLAAEHSLAPQI